MTRHFPLQLMMLKSTKPRVIVSEGEFQNITENHNHLTASLFPIICPKSWGRLIVLQKDNNNWSHMLFGYTLS